MPNAYIRNFRPMGNGPAMAAIVDMLIEAGWTYQASGTGTNGIFSPAPTTVTISNASPGVVSWTAHGLRPNVPVVFTTTGTLPVEITAGQNYFITTNSFTANSFTVSSTLGGTAIDTSSASTGTTTATVTKVFTNTPIQGDVVTASSFGAGLVRFSNGAGGPTTVFWPSHGLAIGDAVRFDANSPGNLPSGVSSGTTYFIIASNFTTDSFRISATVGGTAVNTTSVSVGFNVATCPTSWANANAWARIQDPSGTREFLFQHNNNTTASLSSACGAKIRYSASAKFVGVANGAVSATVPPTASDERYLRGSSSTYGTTWFPPAVNVGAAIFQGAAMASAPYGFWFACTVKGGQRFTGMLFDPVVSVPEDPDPYVIHIGGASSSYEAFAMHGSAGGLGRAGGTSSTWTVACGGTNIGSFAYMDVSKTLFLYVQPLAYTTSGPNSNAQPFIGIICGTAGNSFTGTNTAYTGLNTFSGSPDALPVAWARLAAPSSLGSASQTLGAGLKGWSTMTRWTTLNRSNFVDTLDNKNWICVGPFWLPWDGITTPVGS